MGSWIGGAGDVRRKNLQFTGGLVLDEPDEAGAEHSIGSREEIRLEGFHGRAGFVDGLEEFRGNRNGRGGLQVADVSKGLNSVETVATNNAAEEEMVVMGH